MEFLEVSARTVEDAITKACVDMGLSSDQLDIQVISEGSTGFLGIGSKPAVIQARKKAGIVTAEEEAIAAEAPAAEGAEADAAKEPKKKGASKGTGRAKKAAKPAGEEIPAEGEKDASRAGKAPKAEKKEVVPERTEEEIVSIKASATQFLDSVCKAMELPVSLTVEYEKETGGLNVDMEGEDMGILIGKRGQTLDSLQYLTSLVVNKDVKDYVRVKLDTEDYRKRRKETLENLAKNIANKVKRNQKPVTLEAMNPYERRIIHSALQNNNAVETYSEGNEPYRHVVVVPRRGGREDA